MDEAEQLADRLAVVNAGRVLATGTAQELIARSQEGLRVRFSTDRQDVSFLAAVPGARAVTRRGAHVEVQGGGPLLTLVAAALVERGIVPDLVLGTSVGAINGVAIAAEPTLDGVARLAEMWSGIEGSDVFEGSVFGRLATLARTRTHLHGNEALRRLLGDALPARFEDLAVPFECVAASIERASEHWFTSGPLVDAVMASPPCPGSCHRSSSAASTS
jgi:hypothetical protein